MKLRKLKKSKYPNINLQVLKLYSKKKIFTSKTEIKLTEILLKKIANIIYLYHITNKTILFLGFPNNFEKVLKKTRHLLLPEFMWQHNMLNDNVNLLNKNKKTKIPKNIFKLKTKLKKKIDLIVINGFNTNKIAYKESYLARIPAITIAEKEKISKIRSNYNSTGNYVFFREKPESTNFFFSFLKTIIIQAKKNNRKFNNNF